MALEVLILLAGLFCAHAWDIDVLLNCTQDWMMVSVSSATQSRTYPYVFADELVLGQGCPATEIQPHQYSFVYPVFQCGIRTKVISEETVGFETELYFIPRYSRCEPDMIHLYCFASRKSVGLHEDPKIIKLHFMADVKVHEKSCGY
ncbi:oocyte-secreted protein 2 [Meriones unguiculatus]|uniref:oocyte-secreted protein 2 n=1 Tax=Meriones unguiculatus TaxID=10047 RepID=UPI00293E846B|nr:oocyte-secreted protein 2 [Meriones unguiculatus]